MCVKSLYLLFVTTLPIIILCSSECLHGNLNHCTCVNVTHDLLTCPASMQPLFVYQSLMSESAEVMTLTCDHGVRRSVLNDIELSGVAGQTVSVKMVGCSVSSSQSSSTPTSVSLSSNASSMNNNTEMIRLCTPGKKQNQPNTE